ncbi:hypothetical protein BURPS668_0687 [Burkholderia pseudomallei 668]|nr:hypothetical protein BURPS668_0687 [Burkholderia pseudomallei 668]
MSGRPGRPSLRRAARSGHAARSPPGCAARTVRRGLRGLTCMARAARPAYAARPRSTLSRTISERCIVSEAGSCRCTPPDVREPADFLTRWKLQS